MKRIFGANKPAAPAVSLDEATKRVHMISFGGVDELQGGRSSK
jgi:hypothetical protein